MIPADASDLASTKVPTDWLNWSHSAIDALRNPVSAHSSEIWMKNRRTCRVRHHVGRDRAEVGGQALGERPAERHRQEEGGGHQGGAEGRLQEVHERAAGGEGQRERAVSVTAPRIMIPGTRWRATTRRRTAM